MSIEFRSQFNPPLTDETLQAVKNEIRQRWTAAAGTSPASAASLEDREYELVRESGDEFGFRSMHPGDEHAWREQVTVSLSPAEFYIAFHAATRSQRESFLSGCRAILSAHAPGCEFEEL